MTFLPELEARLVEAASERSTTALLRRRARWVAGGVRGGGAGTAVLAVTLCALLLAFGAQMVDRRGAATIPPPSQEALAKSKALTQAPTVSVADSDGDRALEPAQLEVLVRDLERQLPYPPGMRDGKLAEVVHASRSPGDMGATSHVGDITLLAQYRAVCLWQRAWLATRDDPELAGTHRAAATVLGEAPRWSALRAGRDGPAQRIAAAVARGDVALVERLADANCGDARFGPMSG